MRPGLTGLWQVEARDNPSFHAYRRMDLHYVRNWCLALDLRIIVATLPAVLARASPASGRPPDPDRH
jgi:lipopolysaccharide/colanic/teichoic acid biosynthesis glycosyltransferase